MCRAMIGAMAKESPYKDKEGTGKGRKSSRAYLARQAGDVELAKKLAPPSERPLADEERCGALTQKTAKNPYCQSKKGSRTDHPGYGTCAKHGGNTPAGVKSAMREMGHDLATKFKAERRFGGDRHDPSIATLTPEQAMLEEVRRTAAFVRFLEERIAAWNLDPVHEGTIENFATVTAKHPDRRKRVDEPALKVQLENLLNDLPFNDPDSPQYLPALTVHNKTSGLTSFTDAREWLYLYREERGHLARVSKMCIDAGVASRLVSIAEDQGRILATAIRAVLNALNLSPQQHALIPYVVPPVLRAVASDQPLPDVARIALELTAGTTEDVREA